MSRKRIAIVACLACGCLSVAIARAFGPSEEGESERKVKESEVPKAALAALKKHAGDNAITEFAEEIEHGCKYYEGSWKTASGHVDVLVTDAGALVEIEEGVSADSIPAAVAAAAEKVAGKGAKLRYEKKTMVMYEVKFEKDKRRHELVLSPDGREHEHEDEQAGKGEDGDD
ncbi:MAG: hypothetical protein HZA51_03855 [Planctomycetes bacterium]|nr:hypothetical protein [Planctomycetota bacterium]